MISIIVPIFNCNKHIEECLNSIINQTVKELQIILIDDGSFDGSEKVCDHFANIDERIEVIHVDNSGVSTARNIGISNAKGEWISFVDSDDYISPDYCEVLLKAAYKEKNVDMVIGRTISFNDTGLIDDGFSLSQDVVIDNEKAILYKSIFIDNPKRNIIPHISTCSAKLIRRKMVEDNKIKYKKDLSIYEDAIFNIEVIYNSRKIAVIDKKIYFYRLSVESSSNSLYNLQKYEKVYDTLKDYEGRFHIDYFVYEDYFKIKNLNMILLNAARNKELSNKLIKDCFTSNVYRSALSRVEILTLPKRRKLLVFLYRIRFYKAIYFEYRFLR